MTQTPDGVAITLSNEQYSLLLMVLGYAIGSTMDAVASGQVAAIPAADILDLANVINEGNPHWTRYEVTR